MQSSTCATMKSEESTETFDFHYIYLYLMCDLFFLPWLIHIQFLFSHSYNVYSLSLSLAHELPIPINTLFNYPDDKSFLENGGVGGRWGVEMEKEAAVENDKMSVKLARCYA